MIPTPRTGAELRYLREVLGRTQEQQARLLDCHPSTIAANEHREQVSGWLRRRIERTDGPGGWRTWRGILQGQADRKRQLLLRAVARRSAA